MLPNTEIVPIFQSKALTANALNSFSEGFPLGSGYIRLILRINIVLTNTTGTSATSEGELSILKALTFKTSRGETIVNGLPGRALYRIDQIKSGTANAKDAIATTGAPTTYRAQYNIWFSDPLAVPEDVHDTILDTSRYDSLKLDLLMGGVADLLGSVGDATVSLSFDLYVEKLKGVLTEADKPKDYVEYFVPSPVNPSNSTEMNLEKAPDLAYKRVYLQTANSATSGVAFSGTPANTTLSDVSLDTNEGKAFETIPFLILNALNKADYQQETAVTGMVTIDMVKGKNFASLYAGDKSRLRIQWTNGTLSTSQISAATEALRPLK